MSKEFLKYKVAYTCLILGLALAMISFMAVWPNPVLERLVIAGLVIFYFVWGVVSHVHAERISRRIVAEYLFISLLAGSVLFFVTL
jgi:hypothetical protein